MDKKTFGLFIIILLATYSVVFAIRNHQPASAGHRNFDEFPLRIDGWQGQRESIPDFVTDILQPKDIFSASYVNAEGVSIHVFFDFFSSDQTAGGPHSPRHCLPGGGWTIWQTEDYLVPFNGRTIDVGRFNLRFGEREQVMDFWYITHYGETSNDYVFKIYELVSSLTFQPRDVGFVRFVTDKNPKNLAALEDFQQKIIPIIYGHLPFD